MTDSLDPDSSIAFAPVPGRVRHDGWTPARQAGFIAALARSGCVDAACRAVGMSRKSAYALRQRPGADGFAAAWDQALDIATDAIADALLDRATEGVAVPLFYRGRKVGERRRHDDRLGMYLLSRHRPPPPAPDPTAAAPESPEAPDHGAMSVLRAFLQR